ncbi:TetR/AcrR family transcriptional regulator, partial [Nocardiopsis rhodophaea]
AVQGDGVGLELRRVDLHGHGVDSSSDSIVRYVHYSGGSPESTAADMLRAHILSVAEFMRGHRSHLRALSEIFVNFRTMDGSPRYGIAASEEIYTGLEDLFRGGQAKGEFREFDTRVMAVSLQASIDSMFAYWVAYPDHNLEAHARELADIFHHATRAERPAD